MSKKKRPKFRTPLARRKRRREWNKTPRGRYTEQRKRARQRGVEWLFTFESWWALWQKSGHWAERGRTAGKYCMSRAGDAGPYSPGNCRIILWEKNSHECCYGNGLCHTPPDLPPSDTPF